MTTPFELQMIHKESGVQLFSYRFRDDIKLEPTLISGFISAVISFAEELKPSEGKEFVKYIDRGDFILQVEPGDNIIGLLILSSKDYSYKEKLKILVNEFEQKYQNEIANWSGFSTCFTAFEEQVKQLITKKPLSPYHIPQLVDSDRAPQKLDDIKWAIITRINGQNDINDISDELDISVEVVQSIIAYFEEVGLVKTHFSLTDDSVLELTKKGLNALDKSSEQYDEIVNLVGEIGEKILSTIKTEKALNDIKNEMEIDYKEMIELIEKLVSERYLEILPKWKVVLDKKIFQFTRSLEFFDDFFQLIYDETDNWLEARELERVKRNTYALLIIKDENVAKLLSEQIEYLIDRNNLKKFMSDVGDLNDITTRLERFFKTLRTNIEREIGTNITKDIFGKVSKRMKADYSELVKQELELSKVFNWL